MTKSKIKNNNSKPIAKKKSKTTKKRVVKGQNKKVKRIIKKQNKKVVKNQDNNKVKVIVKKQNNKVKKVIKKVKSKKKCKLNKDTAAILAILLGSFGIHKFYLKDSDMGVLYLVFFWTLIPTIISIMEGIYYLTLTDKMFAKKYCK